MVFATEKSIIIIIIIIIVIPFHMCYCAQN